ncbi:hypothetical protein LWI29_023254 [Acer saccharum]|uniref:RNA helicase n=1 Tax=Acer saccharum TaxID=4024 RepID=A0AA39RDZ7_ACESA|nr:hypothetical protein LWI29_023254 [Acer saccharum]
MQGSGTIDGQGSAWWKALLFHSCNNFDLREFTIQNSQKLHISINNCNGGSISNIHINSPADSPNTDGIDISLSTNVHIHDSLIKCGDDCIAINGGCSNINITGIACGPGHGISVGSLGDGDKVEEVHIRNCNFTGTQNGARIKTFQTNYIQVSDVSFVSVHGTSASEQAITLDCSGSANGCSNIVMSGVNITSSNPGKENEDELLDYEDEDAQAPDSVATKANGETSKKGYVGIHSSGFRDFLLKPELLRAIVDSGFEHPSEVQHECIPQAILGMDVICQAKSGMGKTAVFVLSSLQQTEPNPGQVTALVLCHTGELAYQICHEFERFSTYLPDIKVAVFYGGVNIKIHKDLLKNECPQIVVGTPGRILALAREKDLSLKNVRHFILDECDKMLESLDMRRDVQEIFKMTPHDKQVMMFSATLSKEIRPVCKIQWKFMLTTRPS